MVWMLSVQWAGAATVLSGNISGTWTTNGSPYILSADCTVVSNQTLTIQPGVEVIIGPGVAVFVYGGINAIGAPQQSVIFRGSNPTNYWSTINLVCSGFTNRFVHCRFSDADESLFFIVRGGNQQMNAEVINCDFVNCRFNGVAAFAQADSPGQDFPGNATIAMELHNCVFNSCGNGSAFYAAYGGPDPGNLFLNAHVTDNTFKNLKGVAVLLELSGNTAGTNVSRPLIANNTIVNAERGVSARYPQFQPVVRNNLFMRTSNAVHNVNNGPGTFDVSYNCFYSNTLNFVYYPPVYGVPVQNNHNGDPCDAFFNFFLNPQLLDTNSFLLANFSPCIDAGDPAIADVCFQFSHGSAISDIGAYGGPDACGWLTHGFAPVITKPPGQQSSCAGGSATFQVTAEGYAPLSYRWYFNTNSLLAGETNAQLNLANLQTNQAGLYSVTVSNAFGSVTSAPARLLVFDACVGINLYAGLSITGIVGRTYVVDAATNLASPNWVPFATNTFTQPRWLLLDTNTPFNPGRFFRVRLLP
jgi:hypothetical protein